MLLVLSPSKTLDFESPLKSNEHSQPALLESSAKLIKALKTYSTSDIEALMDISPKLAALNAARYQSFKTPFSISNARPAIHAFKGDVYDGFDVDSLSAKDIAFAQDHVRILSGLYGVLRPLDLMQAYRLEMGTALKVGNYKNLYEFWGDTISQQLHAALKMHKNPTLINLASEEYFKAVDVKALGSEIITPVFKEKKGKDYKIIGLFAKKARGMMARFIVKNQITQSKEIKDFDVNGYTFQPKMSTQSHYCFIR